MISTVLVPLGSSGATWQLKEDADFRAAGHKTDGILAQDGLLMLAYTDEAAFQKTFTGGPGQKEWQDSTKFYSKQDLDTSGTDGVKLEKESWTKLKDAPVARNEHVAVWDSTGKRMVVYGGINDTAAIASAYTYRPSTDEWTQLQDAPVAKHWMSASWETQYSKIVVHGGMSGSGMSQKSTNDTWALDPATGAWTQLANASLKRYSHTSVWDPVDQRHIIFGGYAGGTIAKDTWLYEPIGNTWEQKAANSVAVYEHSAVWADGPNVMLVYAGLKSGGTSSKDLWSYDPAKNSWAQRANGGTERSGHSAAWNPETKEMVVVGGHIGQSLYNDTWIYSYETDSWRQGKSLPGSPRSGQTFVWSPDDKAMVLYGGEVDVGTTGEVWAYSPYYIKTGTLVSSSFDVSDAAELTNVTWFDEVAPGGCSGASIKLQLASSFTLDEASYVFAGPMGTQSYYQKGDPIDKSLVGKKYVRYKAFLSTTDTKCTPVLKEVRIGYRTYSASGEYTSAVYDTGSSKLYLSSAAYSYDDPTGTEVRVFLRSDYTMDMATASNWEELSSKDTDIKTPPRRYVQFKVTMGSTDPGRTPTLESVELNYNSLPQVLASPVEPTAGTSATEFVYKVIYTDGDGETPISYKVFIDDKEHDMQPQDYDYRTGANFTYKTKLSGGVHTFRFEFSDGKNTTLSPATGSFQGPTVNDPPTAVLNQPARSTGGGKKFRFDASSSTDPDGGIKQYKFEFGDGTDSGWVNDSKVVHTYKKAGTYKAKVTVKDALGGQATSPEVVVKAKDTSGFIPAPGLAGVFLAMAVAALVTMTGQRCKGGRLW